MHRISSCTLGGVVLAALLVVASSPSPAAAEPSRDEFTVLLYPKANYQGEPRRYALAEGDEDESWVVYDARYPERSKFGSLRVGRRVGVLLQERPWGDRRRPTVRMEVLTRLEDVPDLGGWRGREVRHIVVFVSAVDGRRRGELERIREYPDGGEFGLYKSVSVLGGSNPRFPEAFVSSHAGSPGWEHSAEANRVWRGTLPSYYLWGGNLHWLRVYGAQTVVTIEAGASQRWNFTTHGKPFAEYDLRKSMVVKRVLKILVRPRNITIVPDDSTTGLLGAQAAARDYWVYAGGHFIKTTGSTWEVYAQGRKVYSLQETRRTKEFVELRSTTHALWIRLRDDSSRVLDPNRGASDWQKQYTGQWRDHPREGTAQPGTAPVVPDPAALMRKVPKVVGLTREAADKAIRAVGLVPVFQLLPGGSGGSTQVVAQSPTLGASLAVGGRVMVRYRSVFHVQQPPSPGPQATGPAARNYWTYSGGHFIKLANGAWGVYAGGRKVFTLQEARRTPEFVELRSPVHALTVRLRADSSWVLDPKRGATDWTKQYDGQWRAHPTGGR